MTAHHEVVVNARFRNRRNPSGVDYYADYLVRALGLQELRPSRWMSGPILGDLWEQLVLPIRSRGSVLLSPCNSGPLLKRRQILIVHDLAPIVGPQWFSLAYRLKYAFVVKLVARRVASLASVSPASARAIEQHLHREVHVIPNVPERREAPEMPSPAVADVLSGPFLLSVSNLEPRKNLGEVFRAWELFRTRSGDDASRLAIVGADGSAAFQGSGGQTAADVPGVVLLGRLSDSDLAHLYNGCAAVITFPLHEGFGRVLVEGLLHGAKVIASDIPAHREFSAAVTWVQLGDVDALADQIEIALTDSGDTENGDVADLLDRLRQSLLDGYDAALKPAQALS